MLTKARISLSGDGLRARSKFFGQGLLKVANRLTNSFSCRHSSTPETSCFIPPFVRIQPLSPLSSTFDPAVPLHCFLRNNSAYKKTFKQEGKKSQQRKRDSGVTSGYLCRRRGTVWRRGSEGVHRVGQGAHHSSICL